MNASDAETVLAAGLEWVRQHHRSELKPAEVAELRRALRDRVHDRFLGKPGQHDLVALTHRCITEIIDRRRDGAQQHEHRRMVRA